MNFNTEMSSRYLDSRPSEFLRAEDKTPVDGIRSRVGRAAWPFLVAAASVREVGARQDIVAGEPSFSS